jgi:hypothetical protein
MTAVKKYEGEPLPAPSAVTPMEMLDRAIQSGAGIEVLEKLMSLQERWEANQGRKAFDAAMSEAKAEIGPIIKNREVDFTSNRGRTNYRFEDLAQIANQINPILAKHGLSYRYNTEQRDGNISVTCIVSHRDGYSERNTLTAPADNSGNKNGIQAIGSTTTFLQRYTLKASFGLAVAHDDDGASIAAAQTVSDDQITALEDGLTGLDVDRFLNFMRVEQIRDIPANQFNKAMTAIRQERANNGR